MMIGDFRLRLASFFKGLVSIAIDLADKLVPHILLSWNFLVSMENALIKKKKKSRGSVVLWLILLRQLLLIKIDF